jgi:hypothetical protein
MLCACGGFIKIIRVETYCLHIGEDMAIFCGKCKDINVSRISFCKLGTSFTEVRRYGDLNDSLEYEINVSQPPLFKLYTAFIKSKILLHYLYAQFLSMKKYNDVGIILSLNHAKKFVVTHHYIRKQ